jgi:hypothetical protein
VERRKCPRRPAPDGLVWPPLYRIRASLPLTTAAGDYLAAPGRRASHQRFSRCHAALPVRAGQPHVAHAHTSVDRVSILEAGSAHGCPLSSADFVGTVNPRKTRPNPPGRPVATMLGWPQGSLHGLRRLSGDRVGGAITLGSHCSLSPTWRPLVNADAAGRCRRQVTVESQAFARFCANSTPLVRIPALTGRAEASLQCRRSRPRSVAEPLSGCRPRAVNSWR